MRRTTLILFACFVLLLAGCGGSKPEAIITAVEYVQSIPTAGGIQYIFQDQDIVKIRMDFVISSDLTEGLEPSADDYRAKVYDILIEGAHFYYDGQEIAQQFGYWPVEASEDSVGDLTLFYLVPTGHSPDLIRFVYDGQVLGEKGVGIDTVLEPVSQPGE